MLRRVCLIILLCIYMVDSLKGIPENGRKPDSIRLCVLRLPGLSRNHPSTFCPSSGQLSVLAAQKFPWHPLRERFLCWYLREMELVDMGLVDKKLGVIRIAQAFPALLLAIPGAEGTGGVKAPPRWRIILHDFAVFVGLPLFGLSGPVQRFRVPVSYTPLDVYKRQPPLLGVQ